MLDAFHASQALLAECLHWADVNAQQHLPASLQHTLGKPGLRRHRHRRVLRNICLSHRFSYQMKGTQTSFWRLKCTLGPPPCGCELRKCLCAAPKPCPNGLARHEKPMQRVTGPALAQPPSALATTAIHSYSTLPPLPPLAQSHLLPSATSPAPPPSAHPTHLPFNPPLVLIKLKCRLVWLV